MVGERNGRGGSFPGACTFQSFLLSVLGANALPLSHAHCGTVHPSCQGTPRRSSYGVPDIHISPRRRGPRDPDQTLPAPVSFPIPFPPPDCW
ncbi:hypothetical protein F5X68DRAFT_209765 [Plectosphaerella plurivora]|uniref:Secreted protein n=1 Tax=Plectosphaerella plurivora TaxID=936078 RepID=A0A9P8V7D0_9PEZI|nr:hypothetical protein F5X68DRAFT_209765 [Plectosphaerella plurivora]